MSDPVSLASLFEAAEQAAIGGDFAAAARLLADAARTQEATLGPDHLDLANTLNNLAVAHERSGQLDDAEREYRRAHAIAARTLPADDPLVTTSAQNLREFCEANDRPVEASALRLAEVDDAGAATTVVLARPPQADIPTGPIEPLAMTFAAEAAAVSAIGSDRSVGNRPVAESVACPARRRHRRLRRTCDPRRRPRRRRAASPAASPTATAAGPRSRLSIPVLVALGAVAALVVWLLAGRGPAAPPAQPEAAAPEASPTAAAPAAPAPTTSARRAARAARQPRQPARRHRAAPAGPPTAAPSAAVTAVDGLTVSDAQLCTTLSSGYQCQAAGTAVRRRSPDLLHAAGRRSRTPASCTAGIAATSCGRPCGSTSRPGARASGRSAAPRSRRARASGGSSCGRATASCCTPSASPSAEAVAIRAAWRWRRGASRGSPVRSWRPRPPARWCRWRRRTPADPTAGLRSSRSCSQRLAATAPRPPSSKPAPARPSPPDTTARITWPRLAPSAIRRHSSRRRALTASAMTP